jgi:anti-sigma-K factor RskA
VELNDIISSGLLELYATGLVSQEEAAQVQQWAKQYPEVADELAQIEASLASYAQANAVQPDASVKAKVFERINEGEKAKVVPLTNATNNSSVKVVRISSAWKNVAAAAVVLLIGSGVLNFIQYNKNTEVNSQLLQSREVASILEQKNKEMDDYLEKVRNKYSTPVSLAGLEVKDAAAKVFWMKNTGDVYVDPSDLPAIEKGKQYELWAIIEGNPAPVNAGIIITTKEGNTYTIQKMKNFANAKVQAFAVSVEPESKTPAVTPTKVYALGKM